MEQAETHAKRIFGFAGAAPDVIVLNAHSEGLSEPGELSSDGAETDDAQPLVEEFVHAGSRAVATPAASANVIMLPDQSSRHREHQHDRVFRYGDRIRSTIAG